MKTFLEHLQESVGGTFPIEDIINNLSADEIAEEVKLYALEACKESLRLASKNVKLGISEYRTRKDGSIGWIVTENKNLFIINDGCNVCATEESILSENNIPKELRNTISSNE